MIRQDQITQAALDYCRQYEKSKYSAENAAMLGFTDGAYWADNHPKTSTLAEACRKKENELRTQMEYEDHRCDKTLYGQFQELLRTLGAMSGCSDHIHLSQHIKEKKSSFIVYFSINDKGTIHLNLELIKDDEE